MWIFASAVLLLMGTPGPGVLSTAGVGAAFGFRAGLRYVFGLFVGNFLVGLAVVSGLAALVLAAPLLRTVLAVLSGLYLCYLAFRIAMAGSELAFIAATRCPGIGAGVLLQVINPKAYAVNTTLFTGFAFFETALTLEIILKFMIINAIWIPVHLAWLWLGGAVKRLDLDPSTQRGINIGMAVAMLAVVGLAAWSVSGQ